MYLPTKFFKDDSGFGGHFQMKIETDLLSNEDKKCLSRKFEEIIKAKGVSSKEFSGEKWEMLLQLQQK